MRWLIATWLVTLRCFAADPFFDAQFQALAQFNPYYVGGLVGDWSWDNPGRYLLNGTGISATYDRSGQGNNLLQATAASQPLISRTDNAGNLLVQSETFATTWTRTRINAFGVDDSGAAGAGSFANTARTLDPLGGNTADFLQEDASAASTHFTVQVAAISQGTHVFSVYVKPAGRTWIQMQVFNAGNRIECYLDLQNGTVGTTASVGLASGASGSIQSAANGFLLCSLSGNVGVIGSISCVVYLAEADNDRTYDGNNTSGLFLYGASLRQSDWSTNYVQTTATIALPGMNGLATAYFDGVDDFLKSAAFPLNQPTFVAMVAKQVTSTAGDRFFDGTGYNSGSLRQANTGSVDLRIVGAGGTPGVASNPLPLLGQYGVICVSLDGASSSIRVNRTAATVGDPGLTTMDGFTIGAAGGAPSGYFNGQVARVLVFNRIPSADEQEYLVRGLAVQWGLNP